MDSAKVAGAGADTVEADTEVKGRVVEVTVDMADTEDKGRGRDPGEDIAEVKEGTEDEAASFLPTNGRISGKSTGMSTGLRRSKASTTNLCSIGPHA